MNLSRVCPEATFTCSAVNLASTALIWFLNDAEISLYTFMSGDQFPINGLVTNASLASQIGGVDVKILSAMQTQSLRSFLSTMTVNISALREVGIYSISCGSITERTSITILVPRGTYVLGIVC